MDGKLRIIDGEPGKGKSLQAVRMMITDIRRGKKIATNIALTPKFATAAKKIRPDTNVMIIQDEEISEFWKHVPAGYNIYVDEAHLIWLSTDWNSNRKGQLVSYFSQFRKFGDDITLLAQNYENLDKFIRQRSTEIHTCRRISIPSFWPGKSRGRPILFWVMHYGCAGGERGDKVGFPSFYTPDICKPFYSLYDTRARVGTGQEDITRPEEIMPKILEPEAPATTAAGQPQIVIHTGQQPAAAEKPKSSLKLKLVMVTAAGVAAWVILHYVIPQKPAAADAHRYHDTAKKPTKQPTTTKPTWYGIIGNYGVFEMHKQTGLYALGDIIDGWEITHISETDIILRNIRTGAIHVRPIWKPKPKSAKATQTSPGSHPRISLPKL